MDLNRATILGRVVRDPELRSLPSGKSVATFSVATGRTWTDQQGQKQKQSEFHNIVLWARLGEVAHQYLRKGSRVYVEGRLQTREWTGQDGVKRYRTEIVGENMILLDSKSSSGGSEDSSSFNHPSSSSTSITASEDVVEEEIKVEDIPF
jgi:single-strand DNA-binding protein